MYVPDWSVTFIYENTADDGLLPYLNRIKQFEDEIEENSSWPDFCLVESASVASNSAGSLTACKNGAYSFVESSLDAFVGVNINEYTTVVQAKGALQNEKTK
jgi:hypothetical protein